MVDCDVTTDVVPDVDHIVEYEVVVLQYVPHDVVLLVLHIVLPAVDHTVEYDVFVLLEVECPPDVHVVEVALTVTTLVDIFNVCTDVENDVCMLVLRDVSVDFDVPNEVDILSVDHTVEYDVVVL